MKLGWLLLLAAIVPGQDNEIKLAKKARELQKRITAIRGLKFKNDVKIRMFTRQTFSDQLKAEEKGHEPDLAVIQKVMAHFGVIPRSLDLKKEAEGLRGTMIAGLYVPAKRELRLIDDPTVSDHEKSEAKEINDLFGYKVDFIDMTFVHELTHAVQDQNFELDTIPLGDTYNGDVALAVRSLPEGDAEVVCQKDGLGESFETISHFMFEQNKAARNFEKLDPGMAWFLRRKMFPYGYGPEFVVRLLGNNWNWSAVDKAYGDLPASTEQIMHPRKYMIDRDHPQLITLDAAKTFEGWKQLETDSFGELGTLLMLDFWKLGTQVERKVASEGWDGDRYHVFEDPGHNVGSVWYTTWDTTGDAQEFFKAYATVLQAKFGTPRESTDDKVAIENDTHRGLIERRDKDVLVLDNVNAKVVKGVDDLWASAKKVELRKVERDKAPK